MTIVHEITRRSGRGQAGSGVAAVVSVDHASHTLAQRGGLDGAPAYLREGDTVVITKLDPPVEVTVVVADAYPNFSICGIPYYIAGEVTHWRNLAHRTHADLEATGMTLRLDSWASSIDVAGQRLAVRNPDGSNDSIAYDKLVIGNGAVPR